MVNYRQESLKAVLKKEYPKGVDCVYESGALLLAVAVGGVFWVGAGGMPFLRCAYCHCC